LGCGCQKGGKKDTNVPETSETRKNLPNYRGREGDDTPDNIALSRGSKKAWGGGGEKKNFGNEVEGALRNGCT